MSDREILARELGCGGAGSTDGFHSFTLRASSGDRCTCGMKEMVVQTCPTCRQPWQYSVPVVAEGGGGKQ